MFNTDPNPIPMHSTKTDDEDYDPRRWKLLLRQTAGYYLEPSTKWKEDIGESIYADNYGRMKELELKPYLYRDAATGKFLFKQKWPQKMDTPKIKAQKNSSWLTHTEGIPLGFLSGC